MATTGQAATRPQERLGPPPGEAEAGARDEDAGPLTDAGTLRELAAIGDDLMGAMRESIAVAKAEARLFGSTAVLAVAIAAVVAVLLAGAWFSLVAAFALGLGALGVPGWLAALLVAVVLAAGAGALALWIRRLVNDLTFARTRQVAQDLRQGRPGDHNEHDRQTPAASRAG